MRMAGRKFVDGKIPVTLHPDRLEIPLHWRKPRRVFVCSMGDLFHEDVPDSFIQRVFVTMEGAPRHTFQVLTKRPERMLTLLTDGAFRNGIESAFGEWPLPNVWLGVTAENQQMADERTLLLLETPAAHHFVSCEPLLGPIRFNHRHLFGLVDVGMKKFKEGAFLDLVIVGGESGGPPGRALVERCDCKAQSGILGGRLLAGRREGGAAIMGACICDSTGWCPKPWALEAVRSLRDQCVAAGVPFHFKGWAGRTPESGGHLLDGKEHREMLA